VAQSILELDRHAILWVNSHHSPLLDAILVPISYAGEGGALWIAVCLALLAAGRRDHRKTAITLLLAMLLVDRLFSASLAHWFHRQRPYLALEGIRQLGIRWGGSSFPSAHAHSVWIAAIILRGRWPRLTIPLIGFALLTCYSRPYLGMHYPLDVIAGSALGLAAGLAVTTGERLLQRRKAGQQA